jgi:hypothetical protein
MKTKVLTNLEKLMNYYVYNEMANAACEDDKGESVEECLKAIEKHYADMYDIINDYDGLTDKDIDNLSRVLNGWDYDESDSNGLHNARRAVENDIDEYIERENLINAFLEGADVDESALHDAIVGKWQNKETGMSREDMAVHHGGMSWDHNLTDQKNMENLEEQVKASGGWILLIEKAVENWVISCIGERRLIISSL